MILIDGKKAAAELRAELKEEVAELKSKHNKVPGLTVILIGDLTPSQIYVRNKEKSANEVGLKSEVIKYCLLYTSPSPRDATLSRMPSSA